MVVTLAGKLIRLHVVANSDSKEDQLLKLQVRDAVLAVTGSIDAQSSDPEENLKQLNSLKANASIP